MSLVAVGLDVCGLEAVLSGLIEGRGVDARRAVAAIWWTTPHRSQITLLLEHNALSLRNIGLRYEETALSFL